MNRIATDVNLASHTHQVPHIGFPHKEPVIKVKTENISPIGAIAFAIKSASGCFHTN